MSDIITPDDAERINSGISTIQLLTSKLDDLLGGVELDFSPGTNRRTLDKEQIDLVITEFGWVPVPEPETVYWLREGTDHFKVVIRCPFYKIGEANKIVAFGIGVASTLESKYLYRKKPAACPSCGYQKMFIGNAVYGDPDSDRVWICPKKRGGCNKKHPLNAIQEETIENENPADVYHTVYAIAFKRAKQSAIMTSAALGHYIKSRYPDDEKKSNSKRTRKTDTSASSKKNQPPPPEDDPAPTGDRANQGQVKAIKNIAAKKWGPDWENELKVLLHGSYQVTKPEYLSGMDAGKVIKDLQQSD